MALVDSGVTRSRGRQRLAAPAVLRETLRRSGKWPYRTSLLAGCGLEQASSTPRPPFPGPGGHMDMSAVATVPERSDGSARPFHRFCEATSRRAPPAMRAALERAVPEPRFAARLAPAGADARAVALAAARFEATTRLQELTQRVLGDVDDESLAPAARELNDLDNRASTRPGPRQRQRPRAQHRGHGRLAMGHQPPRRHKGAGRPHMGEPDPRTATRLKVAEPGQASSKPVMSVRPSASRNISRRHPDRCQSPTGTI